MCRVWVPEGDNTECSSHINDEEDGWNGREFDNPIKD